MFKIILMIFYFLRELAFDNREQWDFKSPRFDPRRMMLFTMAALSMGLNVIVVWNFYDQYVALTTVRKKLARSELERGKLQKKLEAISAQKVDAKN